MQMTGDLFRGNRAFVIEKAPGVATAILRQSTVAPGQSLDRFNVTPTRSRSSLCRSLRRDRVRR